VTADAGQRLKHDGALPVDSYSSRVHPISEAAELLRGRPRPSRSGHVAESWRRRRVMIHRHLCRRSLLTGYSQPRRRTAAVPARMHAVNSGDGRHCLMGHVATCSCCMHGHAVSKNNYISRGAARGTEMQGSPRTL